MTAHGKLPITDWNRAFNRRTSALMSSLRQRHQRKKLPPPPFTLEELRGKLLAYLNGSPDVVVQCRYCGQWLDVVNLAADHAIPLKRGGGLGIDNLEFPCQPCNSAKGGLTPDEFLQLRACLHQMHPTAEQDVINRLTIAVQLAANQNWNRKKRQKENALHV